MYPREIRIGLLLQRVPRPERGFVLAFCLAFAGLSFFFLRPAAMNPTTLTPISFSAIPGWRDDDLAEAFVAFGRSCSEIEERGRAFSRPVRFGGERQDWLPLCAAVRNHHGGPREFFENHFSPFLVEDRERPEGLFTGYFEPEAPGDRRPNGPFAVPLYAKPSDLVTFDPDTEQRLGVRYGRYQDGTPQPYFTRREIEEGALAGKGLEIAWLRSWADAFFMQVQGSGRVRLPDGSLMRLAYAAKSGQPYTAIGGILVQKGILAPGEMSMQAIRGWMERHQAEARDLMWQNRSFVFFREISIADPSQGPPGAQQVELTPGRSLAVDRDIWSFGTPLWIDTTLPAGSKEGAGPSFARLMIAQDTGSAIKGAVRGDIFFGSGAEAAHRAGHMKAGGRMIALLPKILADRQLK
jgi:membrane-bound lytic murein transglycosylase A